MLIWFLVSILIWLEPWEDWDWHSWPLTLITIKIQIYCKYHEMLGILVSSGRWWEAEFVPNKHEETCLNGMQKARTWSSINMSSIFIFYSLKLLAFVPQPIIVQVTQSKCRAEDRERRYFPNSFFESQGYPILAQLITWSYKTSFPLPHCRLTLVHSSKIDLDSCSFSLFPKALLYMCKHFNTYFVFCFIFLF